MQIPVVSKEGKALMPTQPSRARRWLKQGKAIKKWSKLEEFYVQLTVDSIDIETQSIVIRLDPGKHYFGVGVQTSKFTLLMLHINLPFKTVRERMDQRRMIRRRRCGRRINPKLPYNLRDNHRQKIDNPKSKKLAPSIKANKDLELRVVQLLLEIVLEKTGTIHRYKKLIHRSTGLIVQSTRKLSNLMAS